MEKVQVLMSGLIAQRSGRDVDDFETRVAVAVMVTAAMEAIREWLRRDGRGSFVALVNEALDMVEAGARLDPLSPSGERVRERGEQEES
jgi:hypothetical protein